MFNFNGELTKTYTPVDAVLEPWASAITPSGKIAVTSCRQKTVFLFDPTSSDVIGTLGGSHVTFPSGIAVTENGLIVVTDFDLHKVMVLSEEGDLITTLEVKDEKETRMTRSKHGASTSFFQPRYVTVSSYNGNVIVSDSGNHRLLVFDRGFNFLRTVGKFGRQNGGLKSPHATCTDRHGNIFVCDRYNDRVSVFTPKGEFLRHLLTSSEHTLRHPQGIALCDVRQELHVSHGGVKARTISTFKLETNEF
jgi:tripartite motif-containing protein 2/3